MTASQPDLIILGGGLAGGLCALALKARQPDLKLIIVEREARLGGNHIWSFFDSDIPAGGQEYIAPLIERRWPEHEVRFPDYQRQLDIGYNAITSERFDQHVRSIIGDAAILTAEVKEIWPTGVRLDKGERIEARAVLDARGMGHRPRGIRCGWQKFIGQILEVPGGHGLERPIIMDATVDQADGYRFVYCLPFDDERLLVEDTYYQEEPDLDRDAIAERIAAYAERMGWREARVVHEEEGVLPVVTRGAFGAWWGKNCAVARAGVRGGFFHPMTSYSFPMAARFAHWLAEQPPMGGEKLAAATRRRARQHWRLGWFDRMLGRMLFGAAEPNERYRMLAHFYRLPAGLISRFYAGTSTVLDRIKILAGRPPVPIGRAIRAIVEKK